MASPSQSPADTSDPAGATPDPDLCAVFVVDARGYVVASNASARELWGAGSRSLVTLPMVMLLGGSQLSTDLEHLVAQWKEMKAEALDRWVLRVALPFDANPRDVRMRIERASGGAGSYIVTVRPSQNR